MKDEQLEPEPGLPTIKSMGGRSPKYVLKDSETLASKWGAVKPKPEDVPEEKEEKVDAKINSNS